MDGEKMNSGKLAEMRSLVRSLSPSEFQDVYKSTKDEDEKTILLRERCRFDVGLFAFTFFPHFCEQPFNAFHFDSFEDWEEPKRKMRRADAAPRGAAKSTLKACIKPIHDLCYGYENFIVIFSETANQATAKLKDIYAELSDNTALVDFYGPFFDNKRVAETNFVAKSGDHKCKFEAYGSGTQVRGLRWGPHRPSKIVIDDGESSEEVHNEELRFKKEEWLKEDVTKLGNEKTNIEVIGTILHRDSMLSNLLKNPAYKSRMYKTVISWSDREDLWEKWRELYINLDDPEREQKAQKFYEDHEAELLSGTEVLWPERDSYLDLMKEMIEIGKPAFMKERQNVPLGSAESIFKEFHFYSEVAEGFLIERTGVVVPWHELERTGAFGAMDPATGQTKASSKRNKKGDYTCILTGYSDFKGRLFVHHDWTKRVPPSKFVLQIFEMYLMYKYERFGIETNLYRNLILPNLEDERVRLEKQRKKEQAEVRKRLEAAGKPAPLESWGIQLTFYDIENTENKEKRIHSVEPKVTNGYILLNKALSKEFFNQIEAFPDPKAHDDCPDTLEMLWGMHNNRYSAYAVDLNPLAGR